MAGRTQDDGLAPPAGLLPDSQRSAPEVLRAFAVETRENWLQAPRYLNMEHLAEQKKEQMRQLEEAA